MHKAEHPHGRRNQPSLLFASETALLEFVPDAMVITDGSGAIVFINPQAEKMFGYSRAELVGMQLEILMPERFRSNHALFRDGFRSKSKVRPMGTGLELWGLTKEGGEIPMEIYLSPYRSQGAQFAIAAIRDTSGRKRTEEALKSKMRELADFKSALDVHAILAITDPRGRITYANEKFCRISQYSLDELLGRDHRIINSGHHSKDFWREVWETLGRGDVWRGEVRNRAKDGTFYWVDATIVPFLDERGKPLQYVAIRTEITPRKTAEAEREKLIRELHRALEQVNTLSGLLPICCVCKKIRDDSGYWNQIEVYIATNSEASFSHGYCPECLKQWYIDSGIPLPEKFRGNDKGPHHHDPDS